ncbi:MAG: site-2 protease family protein [Jatrophihabitans sp.]
MNPQLPTKRRSPLVTVGHVRGVPVVVSPSWVFIGVLLTVVYGPVVRHAVTDISGSTAYLAAFGFSVVFALCILAHELGHTVVSTALGYKVKRVVLFVLGGVSEIDGEPTRPRDELAIAASGPFVSVIIAAAAFAGYLGVERGSLLGVLLALLAWSNVALAAFNLMPGLPLDGGRILRAAVWGFGASSTTATRVAAWSGRFFAVVVAVLGVVLNSGPDTVAVSILTLFLAVYLWASATQSLKVAELISRLPLVRIPDLLRPGLLVPADLSVAEALRRVWESNARGLVVLDTADRPSAIVDEALIGAIPPERRPWTQVSEVAAPLSPGRTVSARVDAKALLQHMQRHPAHEYLALDQDGAPAGIIATIDFANQLRGARR